MNCPNCKGNNILIFFSENIPCKHCGEDNEVEGLVCQDCGAMWRSIEGEILDETILSKQLVDNLFEPLDLEFDINATELNSTMNEVVHRCIRCNTISYEIAPNHYHCPECSFEWEVI